MTTEDSTERAKIEAAAADARMVELKKRQAEEAAIAAEQDAALAAVRAQCDAYRAALAKE
jgi:hypothetical protein